MRNIIVLIKVFVLLALLSTLVVSADTWTETDFADFADGSFDAGGNIFASPDGRLKLTGQQWDLNKDGFLDIVFCNSDGPSSFIYWGSVDGFLIDNRTELPTYYAAACSIADLNNDEFLDIVFSNRYTSFIYWGAESGFSSSNREELITLRAVGNSVADLNGDGFLDIVFGNRFDDISYNVNSYIYWGSVDGFSNENRTELPTYGTVSNSVSDLNGDGFLDIVFSNSVSDTGLANSFIYWGSADGFSIDNRMEFFLDYNTYGNSIADLNSDGFLEIVFSNRLTASFIYWGSEDGFSDSNRTGLAICGGGSCSIDDLDSDGFLDIVFSNHYCESSYIYWGAANGYSNTRRTELPTISATGNSIADFNDDGFLDIVFCSGATNAASFIYWGSADGFSADDRTELATQVANLSVEKDLGNVHTRQPEFAYTSSAYDAVDTINSGIISWEAQIPPGSTVQFQIRTSDTQLGLASAEWYGPTGTSDRYSVSGTSMNPIHFGDRWAQYRVFLGTNYINVPILDSVELLFQNVPPIVGDITAPIDPIEVSSCVNTSAEFTDQNTTDTHTAIWDWGDSTTSQGVVNETGGSGTVTGNHEYSNPGVYTVILTVIDDDGNSDSSEFRYIVVYDPEGGFATGGGWINSPEGAYAPDPTLEDKANFGFVSKYKKGADVPTGQTEFNFKVADLNFHSDSYDWLVVAGANAKYKGVGTINSSGNYGFMLTAKDAGVTPPPDDVDEFRIKIWDKDDGDVVVYDNKPGEADDSYAGTEISGGNIKIHDPKAAPMDEPLPEDNCALAPFPNPSNPEVWIPYQLNADNQVAIHIYDVKGRLVRKLDFRYKPAGFYTDKSKAAYWDGKNEAGEHVASGVYFYTIQAGDFTATKKMVVTR